MDKNLIFSNEQAVNGDASSADVEVAASDYIDFGEVDSDVALNVAAPGVVEAWLVSRVHTAFAGTGVEVKAQILISDDDQTYEELVSTPFVAKASLTAGAFFCRLPLPQPLKRYMKVNYVITGGNCTAGKVTTYLTNAAPQY